MARKRNYKTEYAARKARARARGYTGPRQEYKARKAVGLNRREFRRSSLKFSELPGYALEALSGARMRRLRKEAKEYSDKHSHVKASRYRANMSNAQVEAYHHAFVKRVTEGSRRGKAKEKKLRIYQYLTEYGYPVEGGPEDWKSNLEPA